MSEMVGRVQRAVAAAHGFEEYVEISMYRDLAIAAIKAMREPTEEMLVAGLVALVTEIQRRVGSLEQVEDGQLLTDEQVANRYMNLGAIMRNGLEVNAAFSAMIDAALPTPEKDKDDGR